MQLARDKNSAALWKARNLPVKALFTIIYAFGN